MSKSTALNELQKIENSRQILYNIQNEAGLDVNKNDSLLNLSMNTSSLLNANEDYDLWQPDEVWWDIDTLWKNDPLRTVNGGEYKYCSYYLIYNKDDTTTLGSTSYYFGSKFKTSDGGEYTASSDTAKQQFSHTWDKSQDKDWQGQIKTRWVAVYSNNDTLSSYYIPNFNQSILYVIYSLRFFQRIPTDCL